MSVSAIVLIEAQPDTIARLGSELAAIEGVSEAHSVAGSTIDLVAIVKVKDHDGIAAVVTDQISKLDGITKTQTLIAFRSYDNDTLDAAYEGFGD